ncbi:MAG: transporter substrate-binding protein [Microbacteriaceae bacterium]|jgi:multiple sugar transport system substrate-binding protein|nr:transporter substrate-binding protein [Microbacteriaceae bacterium]
MKRKRTLAAIAVAAVIGFAAAGCSSGGSASDKGPVQLTFWSGFTGGDKQAFIDLVDKFNKEHKDINVKYVLQPWDSIAKKLPSAIAAGSGPDIATPDYNVATLLQYANNKLALPLDQLVGPGNTQVAKGILPSSLTDPFSVNGKLYAAPANFATLMLYYNKDLLSKAGIPVPTTMKELQDDAVKLSNGNGQYGIALADHATIAQWPVLIWADGGDLVKNKCSDLNSQATVDSVSTWSKLVRDHKITPTGLAGQDADDLFAAGKAAFEINGPWAAGAYTKAKVNFDVAPVPTGASGKPVTLGSTVPMIVSSSTKYPKQAQEFFAWWLSATSQAQLAKAAAYVPSRTDMADSPAVTSDPLVKAFTAQVPNARLYLPTEKDFSKIDVDIFTPAIQAATQNGDAASALKSASDQLNQVLGCK